MEDSVQKILFPRIALNDLKKSLCSRCQTSGIVLFRYLNQFVLKCIFIDFWWRLFWLFLQTGLNDINDIYIFMIYFALMKTCCFLFFFFNYFFANLRLYCLSLLFIFLNTPPLMLFTFEGQLQLHNTEITEWK